jgi:GNAT superfamily N-acetyltransferase
MAEPYKIKRFATVVESGYAEFVQWCNDTFRAEHAYAAEPMSVGLNDHLLLAVGPLGPAGFLTFVDGVKVGRTGLWVCFGYVRLPFRRRGIYDMLWNELVSIAREEGHLSIGSGVAWENLAMRCAAEQQGRVPVAVEYRYEVSHG